MAKVNLTQEKQIIRLYKQGFGTDSIAKKLNLGKTTIRKYLLKNEIKFRKASKEKINIGLHKKFIKLYGGGLSIKQIAQRCGVSFSAVRRHLHKEHIDLKKQGNPKKILNPNYHKLIPEKAYILGVVGPGDGFIEYRRSNGQYRIVLEAVDKDFVDHFVFCLKKVYGIEPRKEKIKKRRENEKGRLKIVLQSKEACGDILGYDCDFKERTWRVPKIIKKASKEIQTKYIQGFADSQGCVSKRQIILSNQNKEGLNEIIDLFHNIGISNIKYCKAGIILCDRKSIELFSKLTNFNISYKKEKLEEEINNYKTWKTLQEDIDKIKPKIIILRESGLSYPQIAKKLNISTSCAWNHSKHLKINRVNQYK